MEPAKAPPPPAPTSDVVFSDSILQDSAGNQDESWLDIKAHVVVQRGGTLFRHDWNAPEYVRNSFVLLAGNDFKKSGPRVKGSLPFNFEEVATRKLISIRKNTHESMTFILWGDWGSWSNGFVDGTDATAGKQYDAYCMRLLDVANSICDKTVWLRQDKLIDLPRLDDQWHFRCDAKLKLQKLLLSEGIEIGSTPSTPPVTAPPHEHVAKASPPPPTPRVPTPPEGTWFKH